MMTNENAAFDGYINFKFSVLRALIVFNLPAV
jgi:hypothetical protein